MFADKCYFSNGLWKGLESLRKNPNEYQLLLIFGDKSLLKDKTLFSSLRQIFTEANFVAGSTAGEIYNNESQENSILCIALSFDYTSLSYATGNSSMYEDSFQLGLSVAKSLPKDNLRYVFVLSDGSKVNGSDLIEGIGNVVGENVVITGGMAGDGNLFQTTLVGLNDDVAQGNVVLVGLYGNRIKIGNSVQSGFTFFGPERTITKSEKNILLEIDNVNVLELYKRYLGPFSNELPSSALLFPIAIVNSKESQPLVRTILGVNEENQSMRFAGNLPEGSRIRFMRANSEGITSMAGKAAVEAKAAVNPTPALALVVNCVGRKIVLGTRAGDEIQSIANSFSNQTLVAGFYSYGEFSSWSNPERNLELHNQSVVITVFDEI